MPLLPTSCQLCPRCCGANRDAGKRGVCGADDSLVVARAALHLWEEPCISAGAGSGTVFFAHCPLKCSYCQNAPLAHEGQGVAITVERLAHIFLELQSQDAANINLVTPTHYAPQIIEAVAQARALGLTVPVVYNTSGYELASAIRTLQGTVDVFLTDFKYWRSDESDAAKRYSQAPDYFDVAVPALDAMLECAGRLTMGNEGRWYALKQGVLVRHMMMPGRLEESKRIVAFLWERYGQRVLYSIMSQYTPVRHVDGCPELDERVPADEYEQLLDYADSLGMENYYWQQGGAAKESFIPAWDGQGVLG